MFRERVGATPDGGDGRVRNLQTIVRRSLMEVPGDLWKEEERKRLTLEGQFRTFGDRAKRQQSKGQVRVSKERHRFALRD